jgi:hypothetical protein
VAYNSKREYRRYDSTIEHKPKEYGQKKSLIIGISRSIFVTECARIPFRSFFLEGLTPEWHSKTLFPCTDINNTTPSQTKHWVTVCIPEPFSKEK